MAKIRGCGVRIRGGVYLEVGTSPWGKPWDQFLVDPPKPVNPMAMGVSPIGVKLVQRTNSDVWDVFDWVGREHYPVVPDFWHEAKRNGISRRIAHTADFGKLTSESRLVLLHSQAYVPDWPSVSGVVMGRSASPSCPKGVPGHGTSAAADMCIGMLWDMVPYKSPPDTDWVPGRWFTRVRPGGVNYTARHAPEDMKVGYRLAIFAILPLGQVTVINDPAAPGKVATTIAAIQAHTQLPVCAADE